MKRCLVLLLAMVLLLCGCTVTPDSSFSVEEKPQAETPQQQDFSLDPTDFSIYAYFPEQEIRPTPAYTQTGHSAIAQSQRYYRSRLSGEQLTAYDRILYSIECLVNVVDLSEFQLTWEEAELVYNSVVMDNPQLFYMDYSSSFYWYYNGEEEYVSAYVIAFTDGTVTDELDVDLNFVREADKELIDRQRIELEEKTAAFLQTVSPEADDYTKELMAHNYVVDNVVYDETAGDEIYTIYGALCGGVAVCEGYSEAFQYLLQRMGIECLLCYGVAGGDDHEWNIVKLGENYYHVDTTWDDIGYLEDIGLREYFYFNLSDKAIAKTHEVGKLSFEQNFQQPPACEDDSLWYYSLNALPIGADGSLPDMDVMQERIGRALQSDEKGLFLLFPDGEDTAEHMEAWMDSDRYWDLLDCMQECGWTPVGDGLTYYLLEKEGMILIPL